MGQLFSYFMISLIASSLVMKHNLDWHRRIIILTIPLFIIFSVLQSEYLLQRISSRLADNQLRSK